MDLLRILETVWRHRLVTIPIALLTLWGAVYVVAVREPTYRSASSYILINPPAPPTAQEIASDPRLGRVRSDNPYTRFGDQMVVVNVLSRTMSSDTARRALVRAGADRRYEVAPFVQFGLSSPIVSITGVGSSAATAKRTATVVGAAVTRELDRMQAVQHVDARYRIRPLQVDFPFEATLQASGQLRMLVGVLLLGTVVMFLAVSVMKALNELAERARAGRDVPEPPLAPVAEAGRPPGRRTLRQPARRRAG